MIDSHAHIGEEGFDDDRLEMLARAAEAGVEAVIVVGADAAGSRRAVDVVREVSNAVTSRPGGGDRSVDGASVGNADRPTVALYATAGVAPHYVLETTDDDLAAVRVLLDAEEVVAVGEIGLDYHYDMPPAAQRALFAQQLGWAIERDLPVVIHSREAEDDVLAGLREHGCRRGVIHCFTEGPAMAEAAVALGFYVSFAGILTFKNAADLREIAASVPLERTLIETDSPYLAPVPHRGRRNEPAYVVEVARMLAELHDVALDEVLAATASNARELFRLPAAG